ncbi:MAG: CopD family protein [Chloroflexi bacterium]|nr:CopD family protein [Chloroflexota bacterium]
MSETVISILVWLHVIGVAIWLGGQIITAACVIPALRAVGDRTLWLDALEGFTRRFGRVGIVAMLVIVITGGAMIDPRLDQVENFGEDLYAARWGYIFVIKMALWAAMIALIGLHQFVFGPRQLELARETAEADEDTPELQRVRRITIALSISGLLMTLLVAGAGAFLGNHNFSMLPS